MHDPCISRLALLVRVSCEAVHVLLVALSCISNPQSMMESGVLESCSVKQMNEYFLVN